MKVCRRNQKAGNDKIPLPVIRLGSAFILSRRPGKTGMNPAHMQVCLPGDSSRLGERCETFFTERV